MDLGRPFANIVIGDFLRDMENDAEYPNRPLTRPQDAFELSDHKFIQIYRVNKDMADNIIEKMEELYPQKRRSAIDATTKVIIQLVHLIHFCVKPVLYGKIQKFF